MKDEGRNCEERNQEIPWIMLMISIMGMFLLTGVGGIVESIAQQPESLFKKFKLPPTVAFTNPRLPEKVPSKLEAEPHELLVKYKDEVLTINKALLRWEWFKKVKNPNSIESVLKTQMRSIRKLGEQLRHDFKGAIVNASEGFPLLGIQHLEISEETTINELIIKLRKDPRVDYVIKNYKVYPLGHPPKPNDKFWVDHFVDNSPDGLGLPLLWGLKNIKMDKAWELASVWDGSPGEQVVVAVIDSGIALNHPDLPPNILWENEAEKNDQPGEDSDADPLEYVDDIHGVNFAHFLQSGHCENEQKLNDLSDETGHGTHVAGVIAAAGHNQDPNRSGTGMLGVMGNGQVKIMTLKIFCKGKGPNKTSGTVKIVLKAIEYAREMNAQVINASWTLPEGLEETDIRAFSRMVESTTENLLFVAAAGNFRKNHDLPENKRYPASLTLENVIVVAGTTADDNLEFGSDFGKETVHIGAPGDYIYSTTPPNRIEPQIGTSAAAPFVSGCAAFLQAERKTQGLPLLTPRALKEIIMKSGDKQVLLLDKVIGGGRLNCHKAYQFAMEQ